MSRTWIGRIGYALLLSSLLIVVAAARTQPGVQTAFNPDDIDRFIDAQMKAQRIPGLALAITHGDRVLYTKGYGTAGHGEPVTDQTQFFLASVSKSFTAMAIMQLVEAGQIDSDGPVQDYLPEFRLADPGLASRITIRHLLNHTSGLSETTFPDMALPQPWTIEERVSSLQAARPVASPETEYHYFSPNYGVLARVVEVVSGMPFSDYLERRVFEPLRMENTLSVVTTREGRDRARNLAQGHLILFGVPVSYPEADGYLGGSGGVISTAEDLAHYLIVQADSGNFDGRELITAESLAAMHTPPEGIESSYAMGWTETEVDGVRRLEHNGILSTYSADAVLLPEEGIGIALLYNASSFPTIALGSPRIRDGLVALLTGREPQTGGFTVGMWGWITAGLTIGGSVLAVRSLMRLPLWEEKKRSRPVWSLAPGILLAFAPVLALVGMPMLTARFGGRVFGFVNFYKSVLGIFAWLAITGVLGVVNGVGRILMVLRRQR